MPSNNWLILPEIIIIEWRIINGALALREAKAERVHAIFVISKISRLVFLLSCPSSQRPSFSSPSRGSYLSFFPSRILPRTLVSFLARLHSRSFLRFVLRYYLLRLSRFLAPRNSGQPLRGPLFCVQLVDRSCLLREWASQRFEVTKR